MNETSLFLLGYPLSIFANYSTIFLQKYFNNFDREPLMELFVKSFTKSLQKNKSRVDDIGKESIEKCKRIIENDKMKLFSILDLYVKTESFPISKSRNLEIIDEIANHICEEFELGHISLGKAVIKDCLRNYKEAFFSELSTAEGFRYILEYLDSIEKETAKKSDLDELKELVIKSLSESKKITDSFSRIDNFLKSEINDPVSMYFSNSIVINFKKLHSNIEKLTKDQFQIFQYLKYEKRVIISGCAGSGKTLLAAEKAIRLSETGLKTLLVTNNPFQSRYLKSLIEQPKIQVYDFTNLIYEIIGKDTIGLNEWSLGIEPLKSELNYAYEIVTKEGISFDAIIVDEGQDFKELWWIILEAISLNSNEKILYIFHDDHQLLHPIKSKYPIEKIPFQMSKNCRNAGEIFEVVKKFHTEAPITSQFLKKLGEYKLTIFQEDNCCETLENTLCNLNKTHGLENLQIITNESSCLMSKLNNIELIVYEIENWQDLVRKDLLYIKNEALKKIKKLINQDLFVSNNISSLQEAEIKFQIPQLSDNKLPSQKDISIVVNFAREISTFIIGNMPLSFYNFEDNSFDFETPIRARANNKWSGRKVIEVKTAMYQSFDWAERLIKYKKIKIISYVELNNNTKEIEIPFHTIESFKGLETEKLILFINNMNKDIIKELYIGTSRAIGYLNILINEKIYNKISQLRE